MAQHIFTIRKREQPFVIMDKNFLQKPNLTMQAKGLLAYLLSLPNDWIIHRKELVTRFKNGEKALLRSLKELEANGYIRKEQQRDEFYRFAGMKYSVYETPQLCPPVSVNPPHGKKPLHGKPLDGNTCTGIPPSGNAAIKNKHKEEKPINNKAISLKLAIEEHGWVGDFDKLICSLGGIEVIDCYWSNHLSKMIGQVSQECRGGYITKRFAADAVLFYRQYQHEKQLSAIDTEKENQMIATRLTKDIESLRINKSGMEKWQSLDMETKGIVFQKFKDQYDFIEGELDPVSGEINGEIMQNLIYEELGMN